MARKTGAMVRLACVAWLAGVIAVSAAPGAGATRLPDGRGYELVSAADKNGGDVMPDQSRIRVADDGSAVTYSSLAGFGDVIGGGIASEYMAVRSPASGGQGWVTHGITPAQQALTYKAVLDGFEPRYQQELSADLSTGVVFAWRPLTDNPFVANVANLYLRQDLRTPGGGSYTLVSDCPLCISPFGLDSLDSKPQMLASTPDFSHVLFESALNLASGASGAGLKLYEWEKATQAVTLVGVFPDGRPAPDSAAGTGHGPYMHPHAISSDGRKVFFMANQPAGLTNVYMRIDGATTIKLNRSERTPPDSPQAAHYADSSDSGSRVFFTSSEKLTDDAPDTGGDMLYLYDATKPDDDPHNLTFLNVDREPDPTSNVVEKVVGASADGSTVYFADGSQLVAGLPQPPLPNHAAMYAWHEGTISFVAFLPGQDEIDLSDGTGKRARVSPAGDLVFLSTEPLGPNGYDHGSCPNVSGACAQVYVYRIATNELRCASCNPSGAPGTSNAQTLVVEGSGGSAVTGHLNRLITDDGRRVFFTTRDALVAEDVNGKLDAYEFDTLTGAVHLLSSGTSTSDSYFMQTSPSGDDAFFATREQLVGWDVDDNYDLYDARVGGGFPEPSPTPAQCTGDDCHGLASTAPAVGTAASAVVKSAGNLADRLKARKPAKRRCRTGHRHKKVRGRVRCVKHRRHVHHASSGNAGTRRDR